MTGEHSSSLARGGEYFWEFTWFWRGKENQSLPREYKEVLYKFDCQLTAYEGRGHPTKFLSSSFNTTHYSKIVITWICVSHSIFVIYTILYSCKLTWCLPLLMRAQDLSGKSIPIKWTSNIKRGRAQHRPMHLRYLKAVKFLALVPAQGLIKFWGVWLHFGPKFVIDCRDYKTPAI